MAFWCCMSDRLGCMMRKWRIRHLIELEYRYSDDRLLSFPSFPPNLHISVVSRVAPFFLRQMYSANTSRPLQASPHQISSLAPIESSRRSKEDIMFPTSTHLSALIGLATLIGMCCEVYLLSLLMASPKLPVFE